MNHVSFEKVVKPTNSSFCAVNYQSPYFTAPLHIHPEYELILIKQGTGLTFVGDMVHKMAPGDFMLIGKNLPHLWLSADEYYEKETTLMSGSVYSQFDYDIFPAEVSSAPEFDSIRLLLTKSQRGLIFTGDNLQSIKKDFEELPGLDNFSKLLKLYHILYQLSTNCEHGFLTSEHYYNCNNDPEKENPIIQKVHEYMNKYYQENITLDEIATHAGMNASALCRYYKKYTGKTLFAYLSELRISYAAKLLMNKNRAINQVAYDCGYNNLSHFNRQFKNIIGESPSDYCKRLRENNTFTKHIILPNNLI